MRPAGSFALRMDGRGWIEAFVRGRDERIAGELAAGLMIRFRRLVDAVPLRRRKPDVEVQGRRFGVQRATQ